MNLTSAVSFGGAVHSEGIPAEDCHDLSLQVLKRMKREILQCPHRIQRERLVRRMCELAQKLDATTLKQRLRLSSVYHRHSPL